MFGYDRVKIKQSFYHRVETFILPTRQEASIFLPMHIHSKDLPRFLKQHQIKLFTWIVYACIQTVKAYPSLNRFVMNNRLYTHRKYFLATTMKQNKEITDNNHVVKLLFDEHSTVYDIQASLDFEANKVRNSQVGSISPLFTVLGALPSFIFKLVLWGGRKLDEFDLLPNQIIKQDPLHSSIMIANLGSIQGQSVYHHLFNWGTTSIFMTFGFLSEDGNLDITFTLDERISEGMVFFKALNHFKTILENPDEYHP